MFSIGLLLSPVLVLFAFTPNVFAAEPAPASTATPSQAATVFTALEHAPAKQPLGGSFAAGEKMLRAGDPENEANIVFNERGLAQIMVCGFACLAPGVDAKEMAGAKGPTIPATGDVLNDQNKGYNEAAMDFASRFNKQMIARKNPKAKGPETIKGELSAKELTLNGVTIGKSNLYNSVGRFGTNMFHKEGTGGDTLYIVCWKGDDGTTLAFESGQGGGRDQIITAATLLAAGVDYKYASECKSSKKVSAALTLVGLKLGETADEVERKRGAPSDRGTDRMKWHYSLDAKKKSIITDLEVSAPSDKVNSISVSRLETH